MRLFSKKIAQQSSDTIYHIQEEDWDKEIDLCSYLIAVPMHKQRTFEKAIGSSNTIRAEDYGRVIYAGAGELTKRTIEELLNKAA